MICDLLIVCVSLFFVGSVAVMGALTAACCPLRGKKAHCGKWQDVVLEGVPVVQVNMDKRE